MVSRVVVVLIWLHAGGRVCLLLSLVEHLLKGSTWTDTYWVSINDNEETSMALRWSFSLSLSLRLSGAVSIHVPAIQAGILAAVALTILSIVSIRPIRDKAYEFFLIVHLVLAVICVLSAYFHAASLK